MGTFFVKRGILKGTGISLGEGGEASRIERC